MYVNPSIMLYTLNLYSAACQLYHNKTEKTKYHKMYRYPHETSLITNNSINSNRILLLSGDSTNIP